MQTEKIVLVCAALAVTAVTLPLSANSQSFEETATYIKNACEGASWNDTRTDRLQLSKTTLEVWSSGKTFFDLNGDGVRDTTNPGYSEYKIQLSLSDLEGARMSEIFDGAAVELFGDRGFASETRKYTPPQGIAQQKSTRTTTPKKVEVFCARPERVVNAFNHLATMVDDDPFK
ncbi:hypothetical protein [Hyphomonas sp.]|uniref:hypothetical protein n=1 Tax=Hyphomonas sp. TaxID=87 RepID=UPI003F727CC4